jgi:Fic family protein
VELASYEATAFGRPKRTAGRHGYVAYFPAAIPRRLELPIQTIRLLADAEAALGRLAAVGQLLPNPTLLIRPYVLREALSSTRIEGTQASMTDVFELDALGGAPSPDVEEVLGYVDALEWGLAQLADLPLTMRLVRQMHTRLLAGVRGRERMPGELRKSQNWIGGGGSTIETARFVPPPPDELPELLTDWERFAHEDGGLPLLVQDALLHYQFETLHPFLDGNGRIGRLLIVFFLVARGRLSEPLLYVSSYFESDRDGYYEALQTVRERGDAIPWIDLFLRAVQSQSTDAVTRGQRIIELREQYRQAASGVGSSKAIALVDLVCESPIVTARLVGERLGVTRPTALRLLERLEGVGVLTAGAEGARGQRRYLAKELMDAVSGEALTTIG